MGIEASMEHTLRIFVFTDLRGSTGRNREQ
jgi:hypothetical protein